MLCISSILPFLLWHSGSAYFTSCVSGFYEHNHVTQQFEVSKCRAICDQSRRKKKMREKIVCTNNELNAGNTPHNCNQFELTCENFIWPEWQHQHSWYGHRNIHIISNASYFISMVWFGLFCLPFFARLSMAWHRERVRQREWENQIQKTSEWLWKMKILVCTFKLYRIFRSQKLHFICNTLHGIWRYCVSSYYCDCEFGTDLYP